MRTRSCMFILHSKFVQSFDLLLTRREKKLYIHTRTYRPNVMHTHKFSSEAPHKTGEIKFYRVSVQITRVRQRERREQKKNNETKTEERMPKRKCKSDSIITSISCSLLKSWCHGLDSFFPEIDRIHIRYTHMNGFTCCSCVCLYAISVLI